MEDKYLIGKIYDFGIFLLGAAILFVCRGFWLKSNRIYSTISNKAFRDKFIKEMEDYNSDINNLKKDVAILKEDKKIREAIAKALEELQFKNGLS